MLELSAVNLIAENNFGDTRSGGLAGPTGLVIILLLVIGTVLLIRNMNSRLRRLPERFENQDQFEPRSRADSPRSRADSLRSPDALAGHAPSEPRSRADSLRSPDALAGHDPGGQPENAVDPKD
jgi:hypothetical protein